MAPTEGEFDPGQHLSFADVSVDNRSNPTVLAVQIKPVQDGPVQAGDHYFYGEDRHRIVPSSSSAGVHGDAWSGIRSTVPVP